MSASAGSLDPGDDLEPEFLPGVPPLLVKSFFCRSEKNDLILDRPNATVTPPRSRHAHSLSTPPVVVRHALADLLHKRAVTAEALASSLHDYEAAALGLDRGRRFILDIRGEPMSAAVFEIEISHAAPTVRATVASDVPLLKDPLVELRLRAQGLISADEHLARWTIHSAVRDLDDAVTKTIDDLIDQGRKFNRHLPNVPVVRTELPVAHA